MDLSQKIKKLRQEQEVSLSKLAETSGISKAYLSQLENNVSKQPSGEILFKIASALGTTIADLLDKPVRVQAEDFGEMADGLRELISKRGEELDIREEDVKMLMSIRYRGKQPTTIEDWEYILQSIRIVMRNNGTKIR